MTLLHSDVDNDFKSNLNSKIKKKILWSDSCALLLKNFEIKSKIRSNILENISCDMIRIHLSLKTRNSILLQKMNWMIYIRILFSLFSFLGPLLLIFFKNKGIIQHYTKYY